MSKCEICGRVGRGVIVELAYVGGRGYEIRSRCKSVTACWDRWDAKFLRGSVA